MLSRRLFGVRSGAALWDAAPRADDRRPHALRALKAVLHTALQSTPCPRENPGWTTGEIKSVIKIWASVFPQTC